MLKDDSFISFLSSSSLSFFFFFCLFFHEREKDSTNQKLWLVVHLVVGKISSLLKILGVLIPAQGCRDAFLSICLCRAWHAVCRRASVQPFG